MSVQGTLFANGGINSTGGSITISNNLQVDGTINTPSLSTYYVDVENIASPGILTIGNTFCTSIGIGAVAKPTNIKGALNNTGQIFPNGGLDTAVDSALNIGTTVTKSGAINIGTGLSRTGIIHIGDGASVSGAIHIGNGASASNSVNILNGPTSTGAVNIGNNTTGLITIGSATSTTNGININAPITSGLTMGLNKFITLANNSLYPTAGGTQIGSVVNGTVSTLGYTSTYAFGTISITQVGVYIVYFTCQIGTGSPTTLYATITGAGTSADNYPISLLVGFSNIYCGSGMQIANCVVGTITVTITFSGTILAGNSSGKLSATRIA